MSYGSQLRTMRQLRGLTQEQLATMAGIPNTYLSLMETGKVIPGNEWDIRLRAALDWTPDTDDLLNTLLDHTAPDDTAANNVLPTQEPA